MNYTIYKNGPFTSFNIFILKLLNPFNWKKLHKPMVIFSFKELYRIKFKKFKTPFDEFTYFVDKYRKRTSWIEEIPEFNVKKKK